MTQSDARPAATVEEVLALLKQGKWVDRVEAVNLVFAHIDDLTRKVAEGMLREVSGQDYYSAKMDRCVVPVDWFKRRDAFLAGQPLSRPQETDAVLAERETERERAVAQFDVEMDSCRTAFEDLTTAYNTMLRKTALAAAASRPSPGPATETERKDGWWVRPVWTQDGERLSVLTISGLRMGSIYNEAELGWSVVDEHRGEIFPADSGGYFLSREEAQAALLASVRPKQEGVR